MDDVAPAQHLTDEPLLVLGATGYLGRVLTARVLADSACELLLPVRGHHDPDAVLASIVAEHPGLAAEDVARRCTLVPLPRTVLDLAPMCRRKGIRGVLHCAGSVSYFDRAALTAGNERLTAAALLLGQDLGVDYFAYVSTAFASGYRDGPIAEQLHHSPKEDPTAYTASKRACEHLVAGSGLPSLIARPSVVIGDSRTGRYSGRPYGVYQLWRGFERLLADQWQSTGHAVASDRPLQVVHQDAVADSLVAALRSFVPGRILHQVSDPAQLPTVRQAWDLWFRHLVRPKRVQFHDSVEAAEAQPMSSRQRLFLEFTATNLEIAEHRWDFAMDGLRSLCVPLPVADTHSLLRCQQAFVASSPRLQAYLNAVTHTEESADERAVLSR